MDLWIRSQDKEMLTKVNNLYVINNSIWFELPFYESNKRTGLTATGHNHKLATYKTKERALEVLDEIQSILKPKVIISNYNPSMADNLGNIVSNFKEAKIEQLSTFVYEMPKD